MDRFLAGMFIVLILVLPCTVLSNECSLDDNTVEYDIKSGLCICNRATCYSGTDELHCTKLVECKEGEELDDTDTHCIQCPHGYFKNTSGCNKCIAWKICGTGEIETEVGSTINDRQCTKLHSTVSIPLVSTKPTTTERVVSTPNSLSFNTYSTNSAPDLNESVTNDDDDYKLKIILAVCLSIVGVILSIVITSIIYCWRRKRHTQNDQENPKHVPNVGVEMTADQENPNHVPNGSVEKTTEDQTECERLLENSPPEKNQTKSKRLFENSPRERYPIQETTQLFVSRGGHSIASSQEVSVYPPESCVQEAIASDYEGLLLPYYQSDPGHIRQHLIRQNKCNIAGDKSLGTMRESKPPSTLDMYSHLVESSEDTLPKTLLQS